MTKNRILLDYRSAFICIGLLSAVINVLYLSGSFYMLEVYDRVLPSQSVPTLLGLTLIVGVMYVFQGALEILRSRILARIGAATDDGLSGRVFASVLRGSLGADATRNGSQPLRDLERLRGFLSGPGPSALFDLPWMPLYLGICFAFHPLIGSVALVGALVLVALTVMTDLMSRSPAKEAGTATQLRDRLAESTMRNAELASVMGLASRLQERWEKANASARSAQLRASDITGGLGALSKVARMAVQSLVLAAGAFLVINGQASGGIIIASSILTARALAPVELAIANWRGFVAARASRARLKDLLDKAPQDPQRLALAAPVKTLQITTLAAVPPGSKSATVQDVSFTLQAGEALGVIGPSGSGKSSLVRALTGVWPAARGVVRLDGATLDQWGPDALGRHVGYVPQETSLFAGTIVENISRFDPEVSDEAVIRAAEDAGVHDLILRLPDGYGTQVGDKGAALSAGQRQRIALARALYRQPFLVIMDEPNSNLDAEGEAALSAAIQKIRRRDGIVIVVAHRPSVLAAVDTILVMMAGRAAAFGQRDEILARASLPANGADAPQPRTGTAISQMRTSLEHAFRGAAKGAAA